MKIRSTLAAAAVAATTVAVPVALAASPAQAACAHTAYQYQFTGENGHVRDVYGNPIAIIVQGEVLNTDIAPSNGSSAYPGNVYTRDRQFVANGFVQRAYLDLINTYCE